MCARGVHFKVSIVILPLRIYDKRLLANYGDLTLLLWQIYLLEALNIIWDLLGKDVIWHGIEQIRGVFAPRFFISLTLRVLVGFSVC